MTNPTVDLTALPPVRVEPNARQRIKKALADSGRRIAVLDDDPTGSQTVHDVAVVTVFDPDEIAAGLGGRGSTCFILINTRSMGEADAVALNTRVGCMLFELSRRLDAPVDVISRSDSTLRGHVIAEVTALDAVRREVLGRGYDGVLLIPAYLEAGRFTAGDVHWARVGGEPQPVGETEFARDATFGFSASNLREFVAEKSGGTIRPDQVHSITLDDIRIGGPQRVAEVLAEVTDATFVVVNAVEYADLDVVVLGLLDAQAAGKSFLYRTGRRSRSRWPGWTRSRRFRCRTSGPADAQPGTAWSSSAPTSASPAAKWRWRASAATSSRSSSRYRQSPTRPAVTPTSPKPPPGWWTRSPIPTWSCSRAAPSCAAPTRPRAWRFPGACPPPSSRSFVVRWLPSPPGSSPRAESPPTTSPSVVWASSVRPSWANSCPDWCRSLARRGPAPDRRHALRRLRRHRRRREHPGLRHCPLQRRTAH